MVVYSFVVILEVRTIARVTAMTNHCLLNHHQIDLPVCIFVDNSGAIPRCFLFVIPFPVLFRHWGLLFSHVKTKCQWYLLFFLQYYFDSLLPRVPLPILRQVTSHLEKLKLPTKQSGMTGDSNRLESNDTARRPPSVKASLSVSFGQRAPHRASTRDSSPVRRTLPSKQDKEGDRAKSPPMKHRSRSSERDHDSERERSDRERGNGRYYKDREPDRHAREHRDRDHRRSDYSNRDGETRGRERRDRDSDRSRHASVRRSRSRSRSPVRGRSDGDKHRSSPFGRAPESSNLAKLKDLYGDATNVKNDAGDDRAHRDSGTEEVIRLGGARWRWVSC